MGIEVYYKPNVSRRNEKAFFDLLVQKLPCAKLIKENYPLPPSILEKIIKRDDMFSWLKQDSCFPKNAKARCLDALQNCPSTIKIAKEINRVSVDIVVTQSGRPYFFEFHEKQHRNLSDNRLKPIYDQNGNRYDVPRYLQRLIRDVWRVKNISPLTVVWWDWFERNQLNIQPICCEFLREFALSETCCFLRNVSKETPDA